jgi:XTP/dITP diphosphohydrolase
MKLVLASKNKNKLREMQTILSAIGAEAVLQSDVGVDIDVEETGTTFEENSYLKAAAVMNATGLPAIADDSGIVVDALHGEPGVYSARYGGDACKNDQERNLLLLKNMADVPDGDRSARFVSVITCVFPDGRTVAARGECEGVILREEVGDGGFGYDPLFYIPGEGVTMAQLTPERKNQISHRAKALERFADKLKNLEEL